MEASEYSTDDKMGSPTYTNDVKVRCGWDHEILEHTACFALEACVSRYLFASEFVKDRIVLDVGCGVGYGPACLAKKGASIIIGGDISETAIRYGAKHYRSDGLFYVVLDAHYLPFRCASIDVLTAFDVIEHLKEPELFLRECRRILKNNGVFICSTPNKHISSPRSKKPLNPYHVREFEIDELRSMLNKIFKEVFMYGMDPQTVKDRLIYNLFIRFDPFINSTSSKVHAAMIKFLTFMTKFILTRYKWMSVEEVDSIVKASYLDHHRPYKLEVLIDRNLPPQHIIAVCSDESN